MNCLLPQAPEHPLPLQHLPVSHHLAPPHRKVSGGQERLVLHCELLLQVPLVLQGPQRAEGLRTLH